MEDFLQLGPSKAVKIFQILNLIKQSVSIFGNKMDMGQNQEVILASHGHRQINPCLQGLILVKFARLTLPLNPSSSNTWIKRLVPFVQSIFLKVLRWGIFIKNRRFGQFGSCILKSGLNFQPSILKQPKDQKHFYGHFCKSLVLPINH